MLIKVLVENTDSDICKGEHGLSLYVEYNDKKYLIDSGASSLFAENADKMGVPLDQVDMAFLSHAHYDHSSGYPEFFKRNHKAKVILQESAKNKYYYKIAGPLKKYIGIPEGMLDEYKDRFVYINGQKKIDEGIHIVPHSSEGILERAKHTHMCVNINDKTTYDDFSHEQTIVFEEADGLVCFNSCSHAGVDTIIEEVKKAFPGRKIKAYIGGFHLMSMSGAGSTSYSQEEIHAVSRKLLESSDAIFYSGHCTGTVAFEWLKKILNNRLEAIASGQVIQS